MRRIIFTLVVLTVCIAARAQKLNDSLLIGSWKLSHGMIGDDTVHVGGKGNVYTFFSNHTYVRQYWISAKDSSAKGSITEKGKWELLKRNRLELSVALIKIGRSSIGTPLRYKITSANSNELVLKDDDVNMHYIRVPAEASVSTIQITDSVWFYTNPDQKLFLVNAYDTTKIRALETEKHISISLVSATDSTVSTTLNGDLLSVTDSSLRISLSSITTSQLKDGYYEHISRSPAHSEEATAYRVQTINFKDIRSISGTHGKNGSTASTFGTIAGFSMFSALVVAPLVSINYRNWEFNSQRYYKIAGGSLAVFAVTVPVAITTGTTHRSYNIKREGSANTGEVWFLKRKCRGCD